MNIGNNYSQDTIHLCLNIINYPEDYIQNRKECISNALRYLFQHMKRYKNKSVSVSFLRNKSKIIFVMFQKIKYTQGMREIADILFHFTGERTYFEPIETKREEKIEKTVYADKQNVHNTKINETVIRVLETLFDKYKNIIVIEGTEKEKQEYKNNIIQEISTILVKKYSSNSSIINQSISYIRKSPAFFGKKEISLIDGFICVWYWITEHENRIDLEKRFLEELKEMNGQCTTGHLARLMNVIQGFTTDEKLCIKISNKDQYFSVVKNYLNKKLAECKDEIVLEEMMNGGENYIKFIKKVVIEKIQEWAFDYGEESLLEIAKIVNDFTKTTIYKI